MTLNLCKIEYTVHSWLIMTLLFLTFMYSLAEDVSVSQAEANIYYIL